MNTLARTVKSIIVIGIIIFFASIMGLLINDLIPWEYLDYIFIIFKKSIKLIDFTIDTNAFFQITTIWLNIAVTYWGFLGMAWIVKRIDRA